MLHYLSKTYEGSEFTWIYDFFINKLQLHICAAVHSCFLNMMHILYGYSQDILVKCILY